MSILSNLAAWRRDAGARDPEIFHKAHQVVELSRHKGYEHLLEWLREQADAPVNPKQAHADLIVASARSNTFREVRQHLIQETERAHQALEAENA